jgi:hypothetical protein
LLLQQQEICKRSAIRDHARRSDRLLVPVGWYRATGLPTELQSHDCNMQRNKRLQEVRGLGPCVALECCQLFSAFATRLTPNVRNTSESFASCAEGHVVELRLLRASNEPAKFWKEQVETMSAVAGGSVILANSDFPAGVDVHWPTVATRRTTEEMGSRGAAPEVSADLSAHSTGTTSLEPLRPTDRRTTGRSGCRESPWLVR